MCWISFRQGQGQRPKLNFIYDKNKEEGTVRAVLHITVRGNPEAIPGQFMHSAEDAREAAARECLEKFHPEVQPRKRQELSARFVEAKRAQARRGPRP